jgi:hypothetical protein
MDQQNAFYSERALVACTVTQKTENKLDTKFKTSNDDTFPAELPLFPLLQPLSLVTDIFPPLKF